MKRITLAAIVPLLVGATLYGPCGPIPGTVLGDPVAQPLADWSSVGSGKACVLEVRPSRPHSVRANCFSRGSSLYVLSYLAPLKSWPTYVAADPNVRVRIEGKIYPLKAVRITDAVERVRVMSPDDPKATPSERTWLYRLEPR